MNWLDLIHRWAGGVIGAVLAMMGLTGAILIHRDDWIRLPHAGDPLIRDPAQLATATARMLAANPKASTVVFASDRFGLHQLREGGKSGAGAYVDQAGHLVTSWSSQWQRPELWIFDLHHHLFTGDFGETIIGVAGLFGLLFVMTGAILWWRTRRTFAFRLWPKRMSRPAITMQHRDLGIVAAPLLLLSALTGTMMIFKPVAMIVVAPFTSPAQVAEALAPPKVKGGAMAAKPDWAAMIAAAHSRFPDADFRILALPRKPGDPIALRMKRADEWLPNGRTMVLFDAADGHMLGSRDALAMPAGAQVYNAAYPLHAAKIGGLAYRLVMTFSGLAMAMLGSFAVWSFWFRRPKAKPRRI